MADTKITALQALTAADPANDVLPIVDVNDFSMAGSGTTKQISINNILGCSGTATLASATITGNLTVDSSTLKVDSANDRVGIGTASPSVPLEIRASDNSVLTTGGSANFTQFKAQIDSGAGAAIGAYQNLFGYVGTSSNHYFEIRANNIAQQKIEPLGIFSWFDGAGGTRMTLNATGLGVGVSPGGTIGNLQVGGSSNANLYVQQGTDTIRMGVRASGRTGIILDSSNATYTNRAWYLDNVGSSGSLVIGRQGLDVITFDNSGNCGIGVTPSSWGGSYKALQLQNVARSIAATGAGVGDLTIAFNAIYDSTDSRWEYAGTGDKAGRYSQTGSGNHRWFVSNTAGTAGNEITDFASAAMTLDASGNLLVGVASALASGNTFQNLGSARQVLTLKGDDQTSYTLGVWSASATGDNLFQYFGTEASLTVRGGISYNRGGGLVAYNTTSDYRAKDIIGPVSNSGSLIDSLKVYVGKMKGATIERPMLIAHEAQEVAPYAVTGTKDEVDADGKPKYQQMDASTLVPLLIAEIQSLRTRVQTLETR